MLFLGIDVGTTAVKAALFDAGGAPVATWRRDYPARRGSGGTVEQNPQDWLDCIAAAMDTFQARAELGKVRAVGICSQVNTHVFVGADGLALTNAFVWQDTRAAPEALQLAATITEAESLRWWGTPVPLDASHALARMEWMRTHRPDVWEKTRLVLSPKDYCILHLSGAAGADPISSVGLVNASLHYLEELIIRVPGAAERLPPLRPLEHIAGTMKLGSTGIEVPVVTGTMDAWASLFGGGAYVAGGGLYMSGTSEILALVSSEKIGAPGVVTFPSLGKLTVSAGPTQSGGDSLRWWAQASGRQPGEVFELAARADRDGDPILFLPHLEGERAPFWDPTLRGAFLGLTSRAGEAELALAVLEGVALSARHLLGALESAAGFVPSSLRYGGGGSKAGLWGQIRADCLGIPLERLAVEEAGCLGAAVLAAVGIGVFAGLNDAAHSMARIEARFEPEPSRRERYDRMHCAYLEATEALRRVTARLRNP